MERIRNSVQEFCNTVYHRGLYDHILTAGSGTTIGLYGPGGQIELETSIRDGNIRLGLHHQDGHYVVMTDGAVTETPSLALAEASEDVAAVEAMILAVCDQWPQIAPDARLKHQKPRFSQEENP